MVLKWDMEKKLEQKFRILAMKKYGYGRGSLKKAADEALRYWTMQQTEKLEKVGDPFPLVEGMLRHVRGKKSSVELQHEAERVWRK